MDVLFGSMQRIGHGEARLVPGAVWWPALGALVALVPALYMWGFTVDDALIAVRYAHHIASGVGWRFNAHGASSDGVTPLPWPLVLAPCAGSADALVVLGRAKALGLATWIVTGAAIGLRCGRTAGSPSWARVSALGVLALSVPVAAHAVSGMETPVATALATFAALNVTRPTTAALLAGATASLRPEMAPWALALTVGAGVAARVSRARITACAAIALAPFVCCVAVRAMVWGRPAPLAVLAKPSDLEHGLVYAVAAAVVTLTPVLVLAPVALRRAPAALVIVLAALVHVVALVVAGGDWMPFARLMVPIAPSLSWAAVLTSVHARPLATAMRASLAVALGAGLFVGTGQIVADGRNVMADRAALVASARPALAGASRVAALDVGWVSAATEAEVIDLGGLTDAAIAVLPGGHTSKRVDPMFLLSRDPDALLLYAPAGLPDHRLEQWPDAQYTHAVEGRLARDPVIARHFAPSAWLPLGTRGAGYVVLRARSDLEGSSRLPSGKED